MNVFRDQADGEALAEVINWAHGILRQIERVESNFAASQTDRRHRTGTSMQADADLYRDEAINRTLLLVTANHLATALNRCSASRLGVPKRPTDLRIAIERLRRHIRALDSYCYAQQRGRSPSGKYRRSLQGLPGTNAWMPHWNYETRLTLAGVLHLPTLVSEVRSSARLSGARISNCCVER
jgi:hypothetical protein